MANIETAIENQEEIIQFIRSVCFFRGSIDDKQLEKKANTILELLKEQQPIKPEIFSNNCWCGKCDDYIMTAKQTRTPMNRSKIKFCCHCGQAIDWQEFEQGGEQE